MLDLWFSTVFFQMLKFTARWPAALVHNPLPSGLRTITRPRTFTCGESNCKHEILVFLGLISSLLQKMKTDQDEWQQQIPVKIYYSTHSNNHNIPQNKYIGQKAKFVLKVSLKKRHLGHKKVFLWTNMLNKSIDNPVIKYYIITLAWTIRKSIPHSARRGRSKGLSKLLGLILWKLLI